MRIRSDVLAGRLVVRASYERNADVMDVTKKFMVAVDQAVAFDVQNVAEYVGAHPNLNPKKDVPTIAPPFELMWFEHRHHEYSEFEVGILVASVDSDEDHARSFLTRESVGSPLLAFADTPRWCSDYYVWLRMASLFQDSFGPVCVCSTVLNTDGLPCAVDESGEPVIRVTEMKHTPLYDNFNDVPQGFIEALIPTQMALAFLHCKNVRISESIPKRHEQRAAKRRGDPVLTFRTLDIEPMRKVLANQGGIARNGLKKALHICRGHFATYTDDKPLFGKYSGQFWIPAHVRGTAEAGTIVKDYRVEAPKEVA